MKYWLINVSLLFSIDCSRINKENASTEQSKSTVGVIPHLPQAPAVFVNRLDSALHNNNGTWAYEGKVFSGYVLEKESAKLLSKTPIVQGKENGWAYAWYPSGKKSYSKFFVNGDREGTHRGWWENDSLRFENHFIHDKFEGRQASFYPNGQKWEERYYLHGYEEGTQRAWNQQGTMVTNFTVKKGKVYGVIGRFDCMSVQSH
jgi:hypothetical protein